MDGDGETMNYEQDYSINDEVKGLWIDRKEDQISAESGFYPNSRLAICPRQIFFQKMGVEVTDPPSLESLILMKYGEELHSVVYRRLDRLGWYDLQGEERKFANESHNITFIVDKFIKRNGQTFVSEVKSVSPYKYKGTKHIPSVTDAPTIENYLQLQVEMNILDLPGYMVYLNRDSGQMWMIPCTKDLKAMIDIGVICKKITNALQVGEMGRPSEFQLLIDKDGLPKAKWVRNKEDYKSPWQCFYGSKDKGGWCSYLSHCWKDNGLNPQWREIIEEAK